MYMSSENYYDHLDSKSTKRKIKKKKKEKLLFA